MRNPNTRLWLRSPGRILPWLLLVLSLELSPRAMARAGPQAAQFPPNSIAFSHSLFVVGPNRPAFQSLLARDFPGVSGVKYFNAVEPLLAIIRNNTQRVVKAYVIKWTITNADGSTSTATLPVMWEPPPDAVGLAGTVTVLGRAGTGQGAWLVSPFFHLPKGGFPGLLDFAMLAFQGASLKSLTTTAQSAASVSVALDGAIFGDGVFVGPDTSRLFERFEAEQKAEVDEAKWVQSQLDSGITDQQLRDALSNQIFGGRNSTGTDSASLYTAARGRAAEGFLAVLDNEGQTALQAAASRLSLATPLVLTRRATP